MIASGRSIALADRLIVALDVPGVEQARALVAQLGESVSFYKVGMWLFFDRGFPALIDELVASGKNVFLDYKMYDIPETVRRGVAAVARRGARIVTVHGDPEIVAAAADGARGTELLVFAITVLTSQDDAALKAMGYDKTVPELVALRARSAAQAGAHGVIASALDDPGMIRRLAGAPLLVATPGIRMAASGPETGGAPGDDQKRVATPEAAIRAGADYLVVGRPITQAADPAAAARAVLESMARGDQAIRPNTATPAA